MCLLCLLLQSIPLASCCGRCIRAAGHGQASAMDRSSTWWQHRWVPVEKVCSVVLARFSSQYPAMMCVPMEQATWKPANLVHVLTKSHMVVLACLLVILEYKVPPDKHAKPLLPPSAPCRTPSCSCHLAHLMLMQSCVLHAWLVTLHSAPPLMPLWTLSRP